MQFLDRDIKRVIKGMLNPRQARGMWRVFSVVRRPFRFLILYFFYKSRDLGPEDKQIEYKVKNNYQTIFVRSPHDYCTFFEIYCREDYKNGQNNVSGAFLDIGANIGIAARYFLEIGNARKVYCFEPNPENWKLFEVNTANYKQQIVFDRRAISLKSGKSKFALENSGRYGYLSNSESLENTITVETVEINVVLEDIILANNLISLLKIDVEGIEQQLVDSISKVNWNGIRMVAYEKEDQGVVFKFNTEGN